MIPLVPSLRRYLVPALAGAVVGLGFSRALPGGELAGAVVAAVLAASVGCIASDVLAAQLRTTAGDRGPWVGPVAVGIRIVVLGASFAVAAAAGGSGAGPGDVPEALRVFLAVELPAGGLVEPGLVISSLVFLVVLACWAASVAERTLLSLAVPVAAVAVVAVLVAPVGMAPVVPALLLLLAAGVLVVDQRSDLAAIPPLVNTFTESRRQVSWWRSAVQLAPAVVVVAVVAGVVPVPGTFDLRRFVEPDTVVIEDPNPLAVAARWQLLDEPEPALAVQVDGTSPGRQRLAVLERYEPTGWHQQAEFSITSATLRADPLFLAGFDDADDANLTRVEVTLRRGIGGFRAVPTAGSPARVDEPSGVLYAPVAGVLHTGERGGALRYDTVPGLSVSDPVDAPPVASHPPELAECPDSEVLRDAAGQLAGDTVDAHERLDRIERWLLTRRIYDPEAPGGQTLSSVERFVSQPYARGNLEVFVTSYTLLARCAGVPVRVSVGFPNPAPGDNVFQQNDIEVWVEMPVSGRGWFPLDPIPTPEEQELLAQLAEMPPPEPEEPEPVPTPPPPAVVEPVPVPSDGPPVRTIAVAAVVAVVVLFALVGSWAWALPRAVRSRRRRLADPAAAVDAAWVSVVDALRADGVPIEPWQTPSEVAKVASGRTPAGVGWLVANLGTLADRVRYSGAPGEEDDAGTAWAFADAAIGQLPSSRRQLLEPVRHPVSSFSSWWRLKGVPRRSEPWRSDLPESVLAVGVGPIEDVPGVDLEAQIGEGATGSVFRGRDRSTGHPVAIKVFRFGPGDPGFDHQRFEWEVRIAGTVSGLPHLPEVFDAGVTPESARPYIVTTLFEAGTLLDRVRRGGLLTPAEAVAMGVDVSLALEALHQLGVVHADVKPENIFPSARGWVLGDLGSAWLRTSHGPAASLTPPYAAPEVWRGGSPSPSSDLYSLALTMWFAATGQVPVAGNPPPLMVVEEVFGDASAVVRALDPDYRRRPRSVGAFRRQLDPLSEPSPAFGTRTLNLPTPTVTRSSDS